jgi:hypothetical protein
MSFGGKEMPRIQILQNLAFCCLISFTNVLSQAQEIPDAVLDIFDKNCAFAGCHAGAIPAGNLNLSEEYSSGALLNRPSADYGDKFLRVEAANPARSYLIMKLRGTGIKGERMPKGSKALSEAAIGQIESWIAGLPPETRAEQKEYEYADAFPGISLATLPTTQIQEKGTFAYRIAHRWNGKVKDGFENFWGLDGGAHMLTQFSFPLFSNAMFTVARSSINATFEFTGKWRFLREKADGSMPLSAAMVAGLDWQTGKGVAGLDEVSRTDGERFHFFGQLPLSKQLGKFSVLAVPGVLINGNVQSEDEATLITFGFAAKFLLANDFSIFVESIPILAGADDADVINGARRENEELVFNDIFTVGLEKRAGGHVFHLYATNGIGLAANQYMSGAELDFLERDFRLGFNIYRNLNFPF